MGLGLRLIGIGLVLVALGILLQPSQQLETADAEHVGSLALHTVAQLEGLVDHAPFNGIDGVHSRNELDSELLLQIGEAPRRRRGNDAVGKQLGHDSVALGQDDGPLDDVLELPHVARVLVVEEVQLGLFVESGDVLVQPFGEEPDESQTNNTCYTDTCDRICPGDAYIGTDPF